MGAQRKQSLESLLASDLGGVNQLVTHKGVQLRLRESLFFRLRVNELVSGQAIAIEPADENVGISRARFSERDGGISGWIIAVYRDGLKRGIQFGMVRIENLNHVAI